MYSNWKENESRWHSLLERFIKMEDAEIYKKILEIEQKKRKSSIFLDIFIFMCMIMFVGWSVTKDISQETERQKLTVTITKQQELIQQLNKRNIELKNALQKLLDATAPKKTKSEA